ncbi:inosine triphosphate pyrophosphatase-like protein [Syncephalis fuscata]|nr:inosine triphosphate pyrophosphatase-like protein [Syncephalis fuscata]
MSSPLAFPSLAALQGKRIVLASTSPRRREILSLLGVSFDIVPSLFEETLDKSLFAHPRDYVMENGRCKAAEVYERLYKPLLGQEQTKEVMPSLIIGADTILEKPRSREQALSMLASLRNKEHFVYTGVTLMFVHPNGPQVHTFFDETTVIMNDFSDGDLEAYVNTGDSMDKAGGYGIQSLSACLVKGVHGDFHNVVS